MVTTKQLYNSLTAYKSTILSRDQISRCIVCSIMLLKKEKRELQIFFEVLFYFTKLLEVCYGLGS
jgi:hypothetical protein